MTDKTSVDSTFETPDIERSDGKSLPADPELFLAMTPPEVYHRPRINWRLIIWGVLGTLGAIALVTYGQNIFLASPEAQVAQEKPRFVIPLSPTPSPTPSVTPTGMAAEGANAFTFAQPSATPTPVPGGRVLVLSPQSRDAGWVTSDDETIVTEFDPQNHLGDSFLYAGILDGHVYHGVLQFDLSRIPRGTHIYAASLRLTGLRADQLGQTGMWHLQFLAPEIDERWLDHNFIQIHNAPIWSTFSPVLTPEQLGAGQVNLFEFTPEQLALLERRILEGSDQYGRQVSFRLDGPTEGDNNLFAWDSGFGPASEGKRAQPELFLSLGPPPQETPPPYYVVITSTPTPEDIMTAVANSVQMTAEAEQYGTATPLPRHWVTPAVVTATPTAENESTAQAMELLATAIALTTGEPPTLVTATSTPTYVIITSTPTPEDIMTAAAQAVQATAEAIQFGTATPFPPNWVTPAVVIDTPTPQNTATLAYWQAVALTTGTPTPTPANVQTATPTPDFVTVEPLVSPTATATPTATPQPLPASLLGKIVFLSDREGATEEERIRADKRQATPQITPQPYVFDLETGQLSRLTNIWPYEVAATREAWSADTTYEAYSQQLLWTNKVTSKGNVSTEVLAIHYYDYLYDVEHIVTQMGAGIAYDPVWSPVSDEIAFVATESGNDEIWLINRDGTNPQQLTRNEWEWDKHPSWSPDGQQIIFYSNRTGNTQLWIMNKDGSEQRLLMDWNPYNDWDPIWIKYLEPAPPQERKLDWRFIKPPEESQGTR
jgi:hypothetical protein